MKDIGNIIKSLQNIMWRDQGVSGDAQRIEQLGWMISLKILDDKDKELELLNDKYTSVIPKVPVAQLAATGGHHRRRT